MNETKMNHISTVDGEVSLNLEKPKRILYFSDGIIEEYSADENESEGGKLENEEESNQITENELQQWIPWILYKTKKTGKTILAGCDYIGESLAQFLGITTPKYSSEIEEFRRIAEENKKFIEKEKTENATWQEKKQLNSTSATEIVITKEIEITNQCDESNNRF